MVCHKKTHSMVGACGFLFIKNNLINLYSWYMYKKVYYCYFLSKSGGKYSKLSEEEEENESAGCYLGGKALPSLAQSPLVYVYWPLLLQDPLFCVLALPLHHPQFVFTLPCLPSSLVVLLIHLCHLLLLRVLHRYG